MNTKILEAQNMTIASYGRGGDEQQLIENLSFSLDKGETLGIVGESGSGKSILASSIMHILPAGCKIKNGRVYFDGKDLYQLSRKELNTIRGFQMAMISDNPLEILDPIYTVEKQVRETIRVRNPHMSKADTIEMGLSIFRSLRMPDPEKMMHSFPYQLSGGMQQRVAIALVLCGDVKLLIADDATRSLDVTVAAQIVEILRKMKQEKQLSLVWISNSLPVCSLLADKIMIMYNGKMIEIGPKKKILTNPQHFYTQKMLQVTPELEEINREELFKGIKVREEKFLKKDNYGCEFAAICEHSQAECTIVVPALMDIDSTHKCRCHLFSNKP